MRFFTTFYSNILNNPSTKFYTNLFFLKFSPSFLFTHFQAPYFFLVSKNLRLKWFKTSARSLLGLSLVYTGITCVLIAIVTSLI